MLNKQASAREPLTLCVGGYTRPTTLTLDEQGGILLSVGLPQGQSFDMYFSPDQAKGLAAELYVIARKADRKFGPYC